MSPALAISANETKWTVMSGAMKGAVRLMGGAFAIGRSPECEFVIVNDPKCSRRHAQVQWTENGCEITGLNEANPVLINGREILQSVLSDGDVVTLGDTEVLFNLTTLPAAIPRYEPQIALLESRQRSAPAKRKGKSKKSKANPARLVIYFIIGIVVLWLFTPSNGKKKQALVLRTEQQIQADVDAANKLNEAAQSLPMKRYENAGPLSQAQENFVRGFRDYRKGQFERSVDSFQTCLALDPAHVLCNRYMRLAQRRFSELVQYEIVLGRKYRDQNQFKACRASFRNVMVMVKDANSAAYKEAKANYDACNSLAEGRY